MRLAAAMAAASRMHDGTSEFHRALFHDMVMMVFLSIHIMLRLTNSFRSKESQVSTNTRSLVVRAKSAVWHLGMLMG